MAPGVGAMEADFWRSHRGACATLVACLAIASQGCVLFYGSTQTVHVEVNPQDSVVTVDPFDASPPTGGPQPGRADLELDRDRSHSVTVSREGYYPKTVEIDSRYDGARGAASIVFGLIVFTVVDHVKGSVWTLDPPSVAVDLVPIGGGAEGDVEPGGDEEDRSRQRVRRAPTPRPPAPEPSPRRVQRHNPPLIIFVPL